jgi:hypothetical protein
MKKLLVGLLMSVAGMNAHGGEWVPYVYHSPIVSQQAPVVQNFQVIQYYYAPTVTMAPTVPLFVPVTTYQNVLVERRYHCFFKRYEVLSVPQTLYVPNRY